jgi:hypothetical protein
VEQIASLNIACHNSKGDQYLRLEVLTALTMKNAVYLNIKNPVLTSQETLRILCRVQPVMPCKVCGSHGSHYEECRFLGRWPSSGTLLVDESVSSCVNRLSRQCRILSTFTFHLLLKRILYYEMKYGVVIRKETADFNWMTRPINSTIWNS